MTAAPAAWETRRPLLPELALVAATIAYGGTFAVTQDALDGVTPVGFILVRFTLATIVLAPWAWRRGWRNREFAAASGERVSSFAAAAVAFGTVGFCAYAFQNAGLERTTTSRSAFITGLFVVFAPLVETVARRRLPPANVVLAVPGAVVGLLLLTGADLALGSGEALTLACAVFFGWWIYLGGRYAVRFDPVALTTAQMATFVVLSIPVVAVTGLGRVDARVVLAALGTGVVASAGAFTLQLWGQQRVEPARAALVLLLEPVVAGIVGYAIGERLGAVGLVGALVILASIALAESGAWRRGVRRRAGTGAAPDA